MHGRDTDKQIFFYENEFYVFSNFSSFAIIWNGKLYMTSEHAYHSEKFEDEKIKEQIRNALSAHEALKKAHNEFKAYTNYCYGGFSPREESKIYKKGQIYTFEIRSINEGFLSKLALLLEQNSNNPHLRIVETTRQYQKSFFITQFYTLTPAIVSSAKDAQGKAL